MGSGWDRVEPCGNRVGMDGAGLGLVFTTLSLTCD